MSAAELEASEGNDGEESYSSHLTQEEIGEINTSESELMRTNTEGDIMTTDGEIVGELVMENNDPSVIVESIVNTDGSVFVDEREFNSYCEDSLTHAVDESQSPKPCGNNRFFSFFSDYLYKNDEERNKTERDANRRTLRRFVFVLPYQF